MTPLATDALQTELSALFTKSLGVEVPSPDTDLLATGRLDSVGFVELLMQLEKRFGLRVELDNVEFEDFRSLASIAAFIAERRGASEFGGTDGQGESRLGPRSNDKSGGGT
jgi:acyl carrier protein